MRDLYKIINISLKYNAQIILTEFFITPLAI